MFLVITSRIERIDVAAAPSNDPNFPLLPDQNLNYFQDRSVQKVLQYKRDRARVMILEDLRCNLLEVLRAWPDCTDLAYDKELLTQIVDLGPSTIQQQCFEKKVPVLVDERETEEDLIGFEFTVDYLYDLVPSLQHLRAPEKPSRTPRIGIPKRTEINDVFEKFPDVPSELIFLLFQKQQARIIKFAARWYILTESDEQGFQCQKELASDVDDEELNFPEEFPANPDTKRDGSRVVCNICQKDIKVSNDQEWKLHVIRDIRPYVCHKSAERILQLSLPSRSFETMLQTIAWSRHGRANSAVT
ncbi:uncharacterized protein K452DRAFT_82330 [Aplosporella prunicola CBS 121167]|uniref:Uncharacterized protein n=1 Tax=Aplosporella prunicola CBS 121167 TaxID=1176127 RepID=A0A6A6B720_9PEZI|nr:uncharacterized protein K452DRAFT_82330 [Aplosporella prunicola CBS 121167]KAF2139193.1 hypothetical protein K452DRAFT_82330 [Aplosporella prunicola CBS 121167]